MGCPAIVIDTLGVGMILSPETTNGTSPLTLRLHFQSICDVASRSLLVQAGGHEFLDCIRPSRKAASLSGGWKNVKGGCCRRHRHRGCHLWLNNTSLVCIILPARWEAFNCT